MKKIIFIKLIIFITIILFFLISFIIGIQVSKIFENSNKEEIDIAQENIEDEENKKDNLILNETNSDENITVNKDIKATKNNAFVGIIEEVDIDKKQIVVENPTHLVNEGVFKGDSWWYNHKVIIDEQIYIKAGYLLCLDNVPIKEHNGNKIQVRDLNVGDTINVKTKNVEYINKIIFEPLTSDNIVLIQRKK